MNSKDWRVWLVAGLLAFGLGFCAGRDSRSLNRQLQWSVDSLKATGGEYRRSRDSALSAAARAGAVADSLEAVSRTAASRAGVSREAAARAVSRVRQLDTLLASVQNAADSIPILVEQRDSALAAVTALQAESGDLRSALSDQIRATAALRVTIGLQAGQLAADSVRLA